MLMDASLHDRAAIFVWQTPENLHALRQREMEKFYNQYSGSPTIARGP